MRSFNVAKAKKHFSDLLGCVAYGGESFLITRRGKPMARLVPVEEPPAQHPADVEGWLEDDDPFFETIDRIVGERSRHLPRILETKARRSNAES